MEWIAFKGCSFSSSYNTKKNECTVADAFGFQKFSKIIDKAYAFKQMGKKYCYRITVFCILGGCAWWVLCDSAEFLGRVGWCDCFTLPFCHQTKWCSANGSATDRHPAEKTEFSVCLSYCCGKIRLGFVMRWCYMLHACPRLPRGPLGAGGRGPVSSPDSPAALLAQPTGG